MGNRKRLKWGRRTEAIIVIVLGILFLYPCAPMAGTFVSGISKPTGLAIHPNERSMYVKSGSSGTVWKIPIKTGGTAGAIEVVTDQFDPALDIKFDASGNLYGVANLGDDTYLERIDSAGAVCSSGLSNSKPYSGIAIEAPGLSTNRLFFSLDYYGVLLKSITLSSYVCSGGTSSADVGKTCGDFRFMLYRASRGDLVGSHGGTVSSININSGACTPLVSNMVQPNGLTEDADGNLYIADTGAGKIIKRTILGEAVEVAKDLNGPTGLVFDAETGLLFVSETNANRVVTLPVGIGLSGALSIAVRDVDGQWSKPVKIPKGTSPDQPAAAVDSVGKLYVFVRKGDDTLLMNKMSPDGKWGKWEKVPGNMKTSSAPDAVAANGKIYLYARGFDDKVWENSLSVDTQEWASWKSVKGCVTPTSPEVTTDANGNMYLLMRQMR